MKKFYAAETDDTGKITKGYEVYVNPATVSYCEAASSGETTFIYFVDGRSVEVVGKARNVVCTLERDKQQ